jgi:hypothetical protein
MDSSRSRREIPKEVLKFGGGEGWERSVKMTLRKMK